MVLSQSRIPEFLAIEFHHFFKFGRPGGLHRASLRCGSLPSRRVGDGKGTNPYASLAQGFFGMSSEPIALEICVKDRTEILFCRLPGAAEARQKRLKG